MAKNKKGKKINKAIQQWEEYFGEDTLQNWQKLVTDLNIRGTYCSKTQCRKAIKKVWVNIFDFLEAMSSGTPVHKFPNQRALADYTLSNELVFPRRRIVSGTPMAALLANIM
ncbi:hypothetical protein CMQ_8240 [Grosmannia clavigera kw1407]|uniref:Uncharacterized protein n=1 Tax=Grosmannia clavigera (strain kw1407 / UAMH 11150) TaxID=655863 RepID=F0XKE6_GROCL|nr:uncharacterized protein CMQ_8240 [Grosmannia clavigera kw1407]EFX01774.1 hypothetical protein CMQ_8240 [Grosmannia clavigera kw1407]